MDSTVKRAATENIDSTNLKKPNLDIKCDDDDSHIADLYCTKCDVNLCKTCCDRIHSSKAVSNHEIIKLTEKPEVVYCHLHPETKADLVCKEPDCDGVNNPICTFCHRYEKHKDHENEHVDVEYEKIRTDITNCLKGIETKIEDCNRIFEECEKCIATYSTTDDVLMKAERNKIEKFYSDAKTSAFKKLENFANTRIGNLKSLQSKYSNDRTELDNLKTVLLNFEKKSKQSVIMNGKTVEDVAARHVAKKVDEPTNLRPFNCTRIIYPKLINIGMKSSTSGFYHLLAERGPLTRTTSPSDSRVETSETPEKTYAAYSSNSSVNLWTLFFHLLDKKNVTAVEDQDNGRLFTCKNGPPILVLDERPAEDEIDLSKYEYVAVVGCWPGEKNFGEDLFREEIKNQWCSKIFVILNRFGCGNKFECVRWFREVAKTDERVVVTDNRDNHTLDWYLLQ